MHNQMMPVFHHAFPPEAQIPQPLSAPNQDQRHAIQQLWHHRAGILQCMQADVSSLFQVWFHYSRYKTMKRLQQRRTRLLKRQKLHDLLQEVAHASRCHDSFAVYQTIRKYTPKQPLKRIRLRLSDGTPANADQVMAMTKAYVEDIWHSADPIQLQQPGPVGIPFDLAELEVEIANIPITKAVARSCLPGICWKTHAKQVAEFFYAKLQTWWMQYPVFIPQQWKDAHLRFINEPAKPPDRLSHLRPLALLEPVGKCILGLLTTKFADAVQPLLSPWPQLAFMRQRSTFDAIRRVATHCVRIRQMTAAQRRSVHERARQEQCYQVCGGLQVLLDANKAFDLVPRPTLFHFINGLPIDQVLVTLLSEWHTATNYIVSDGHNTQRVATGRGVRQGCRAAPILWSSHTLHLFHHLRDTVNEQWVKKCLTAFADDLHCCQEFRSEQQLQLALSRIGLLLDALDQLGIQLSLEKSHAIIRISGTNCRDIYKKYIKVDSHGPHIMIPRANGQSRLPVQTQAKYLGIMVGYHSFERSTVRARLKAARHTFARLRRWICAKQIPRKTRLQIWHSCVFTTLVYGIFSTGFTQPDLQQIQHSIFMMYRQLLGDHAYKTHHTHAEILHLYQLEHPLHSILHAGQQLRDRLSHRLNHLACNDILWTVDWTHLGPLLQMVQSTWHEQLQALLTLPGDEALLKPFRCPFCDFACNSLANLRRHLTNVHGHTQLRTHFTTVASHAVGGLPQCSHCLEAFTSWRNFQIHLERNCCQVLEQTRPFAQKLPIPMHTAQEYPKLTPADLTLLMTKPYGPTALICVQERNWDTLQQMPAATTDWTHHCVLCGLFCNRPQDLNLHMRTQHPTLLPHVMSKASQLGRAQASNSPCRFCNKTFRRVHQCPVMVQAAMLLVNTDPTGLSYQCPGSNVLRCDVCNEQFQDVQLLHRHLHQQHRLEPLDWDPLRDMLAGTEPVCSHCLAIFAEKSSLRQHITLGQCQNFNPARLPTENPINAEWQELLQSGDIAKLREAPQMRLRLTLRCQFCQTSFQRTGDLSLHLQTVHSVLWGYSQSHVQVLVEAGRRLGCLCNPMTHASGLQHICVAFRQLGMMVQKLTQPMFLPWTFERAQLRLYMTAVTQDPISEQICEVLHMRHFDKLWTDPMMVQFLRTRCLLCGLHLHPAEVTGHLHRVHPLDLTDHRMLMPQLLQAICKENLTDHKCDVCTQIYNYPLHGHEDAQEMADRSVLAQIHLQHQCPVVLQIALLLQDHGALTATHGRGRRDVGDLQADGAFVGAGKIRSTRRRQGEQETQTEWGAARRTRRRHDAPSEGDGSTLVKSGCGATGAQASRLMDLLHANRAPGIAPIVGPEGSRVETTIDGEAGEHGPELHPAQMLPDPTHGHDAESESHQISQMQQRGSSEEGGLGPGSFDSRGELSVPTMEHSGPGPSDDQSDAHLPDQDGEVHGATHGHPERSMCHSEISQLTADVNRSCGALDVANIHEVGRPSSPADDTARMHGMGPVRAVHEASCTLPEQAGPTPPGTSGERTGETTRQGPRQTSPQDRIETEMMPATDADIYGRTALLQGLADIKLANDSNWCYVNAAFLTTLWSFLSISSFTIAQWGPDATRIAQLLMAHNQDPVELSKVGFLQPIFDQWHHLGNQGDPVEFLAHLMRGLRFTGINLGWEKRVQIGLLTEVMDESHAFTPLVLKFDPAMLQDDSLTLCQMLRDWSNQDGMVTALTNQTPLVCVQIDRHIRTGAGHIAKCDIPVNFHWGIDLPFYDGEGLAVHWRTYKVIAAIAHLGHDASGHCRTMLRVQMNSTAAEPYMFLLTEDWMQAQPIWKEPSWFLRNISCFWLGDWDQLDLHQLPHSAPGPTLGTIATARSVVAANELLSHFVEGTDESILQT